MKQIQKHHHTATSEACQKFKGDGHLDRPLSGPCGTLCGLAYLHPLMDYHPALLVQSGAPYTNQGQQGLQPVSVYNLQLEPIADQLITVASLAALDNSGDCEILR